VEFDGNGFFDYGASPDFNFARSEPFTISGLLRTTSSGPVVSQRNQLQGAPVIDVTLEDGALTAVVRSDGDESAPFHKLRGKSVADGRWHHFALVRSTDNTVELYVDGDMQDHAAGLASSGAITTNLRTAGSERYWLTHPGWGPPYWKGALDEFCIFRRALGAAEIRKLAGR
jgi:hypothetical protein